MSPTPNRRLGTNLSLASLTFAHLGVGLFVILVPKPSLDTYHSVYPGVPPEPTQIGILYGNSFWPLVFSLVFLGVILTSLITCDQFPRFTKLGPIIYYAGLCMALAHLVVFLWSMCLPFFSEHCHNFK